MNISELRAYRELKELYDIEQFGESVALTGLQDSEANQLQQRASALVAPHRTLVKTSAVSHCVAKLRALFSEGWGPFVWVGTVDGKTDPVASTVQIESEASDPSVNLSDSKPTLRVSAVLGGSNRTGIGNVVKRNLTSDTWVRKGQIGVVIAIEVQAPRREAVDALTDMIHLSLNTNINQWLYGAWYSIDSVQTSSAQPRNPTRNILTEKSAKTTYVGAVQFVVIHEWTTIDRPRDGVFSTANDIFGVASSGAQSGREVDGRVHETVNEDAVQYANTIPRLR